MKPSYLLALGVLLPLTPFSSAHARSHGDQAALTLLESPSARSSSLGEAFSAVSDDATGLAYNPALLSTLSSGELSFLYERGSVDDNYAHVAFGLPRAGWSWGSSLGYYDSGTFNASEDGVTQRRITAEKDLAGTVGVSKNIGSGSVGISAKYLSTTLIETEKASAMALDFGGQLKIFPLVRLGASAQNFGTALRYGNHSSALARTLRVGSEVAVFPKSLSALLFLDIPYYTETHELAPGVGLEKSIGPLALRAGYRSGSDLEGLSLGAGFQAKALAIDYAFGLVKDLDSRQRISVSYRFGNTPAAITAPAVVSAPARTPVVIAPQKKRDIKEGAPFKEWEANGTPAVLTPIGGATPARRVYEVKPGDTWATIARREYGLSSMAVNIKRANSHLFTADEEPTPGTKILMPRPTE